MNQENLQARLDEVLAENAGLESVVAAQAETLAALRAGFAQPMPTAATDVLAERNRQITTEGWTPEHDDQHAQGQMAGAAACYAASTITHWARLHIINTLWPWAPEWWKSSTPRRDLVKAGALILAEIERLDRADIQQEKS